MQPAEPPANHEEPAEDGVDVTLIRWFLSLTPAERLATLERFVNSVEAIRERNPEI